MKCCQFRIEHVILAYCWPQDYDLKNMCLCRSGVHCVVWRYCMDRGLRKLLCKSVVLSHFNVCINLYYPCLHCIYKLWIERLQYACLRFTYDVRPFDHISHLFDLVKWLSKSRTPDFRRLFFIIKLFATEKPSYFFRNVIFRFGAHVLNIRFEGFLTPPLHNLEMSFWYDIVRLYNALPWGVCAIRPPLLVNCVVIIWITVSSQCDGVLVARRRRCSFLLGWMLACFISLSTFVILHWI